MERTKETKCIARRSSEVGITLCCFERKDWTNIDIDRTGTETVGYRGTDRVSVCA